MNNEFWEPERANLNPIMLLWRVQKDKLGVFMENGKNLNSVLKGSE